MIDVFAFIDSNFGNTMDGANSELDNDADLNDFFDMGDTIEYGRDDIVADNHQHVDSGISDDIQDKEDHLGSAMIGDPYGDMEFIHMQEGMNSCAVASQKEVIESILGQDIPEIELSYMAYKEGWFDPGSGTMPENMGKILEVYGIPIDSEYDRSLTDIYNALENGEKVIVGLNSNEIWNPQYDELGNPIQQNTTGHAVWVTGLYQDDAGKWFVIMNDTGIPKGQGETVAAEDFLNAWSDFGNFAVITNVNDKMIA